MATDAQIMAEAVWRAEYTPAALKAFGGRVGKRLNCTVYYKGDTKHLRGRHRSRNWSLRSAYCTNRSYGTTNAKDKAGPGDALRACDVMISGDVLEKVCRGIDEAVRAGRLPELAEWFGTFDSRTVVGWFEGHASSSDSSHLTHLHLGAWTQFVDSVDFWDRLYDAMMTYLEDDMTPDQERLLRNVERILTCFTDGREPYDIQYRDGGPKLKLPNPFVKLDAKLTELAARPQADVDEAALAAALAPLLEQGASAEEIAAAVTATLAAKLGG